MTKAQLDRHLEDAADQTFAAFYRRELPGQVRRAALLIGDTAANDIVHDAFVMLYQRWDLVDSPGPYLQRTVLNGCRDRARREARLRRLLPRLVERQVVADHATVWDIINALPFNQRAVVVLKFYDSLTEAEIASVLNCPTGSVGPWLTRALRSMRKALE